jgi:hypothetical protein
MFDVKPIALVRIGSIDVRHPRGGRAGSWWVKRACRP